MMKEPPSSVKTSEAVFKGMKNQKSVSSNDHPSPEPHHVLIMVVAALESVPAAGRTIDCGQVSHTPVPQSQRQLGVSSRPNEHVCDWGGEGAEGLGKSHTGTRRTGKLDESGGRSG